ncbi:MAG: PKD domain-containing protein [Anaerolineae bacterium]|nr:PKD domain-containing protein [Anaerolineae bacterium]MCB9107662.1 PKD domain-containing protein [Anaerolineales bacterium]
MSIKQCRTITKKLVLITMNLVFWLIVSFGSLNLIKAKVDSAEPPAQIDIQACPQGLMIKKSPPASESQEYRVLEPITFTASITGVITPAGTITYTWNFDDGKPTITRPIVIYSYKVSDSYTVILTAEGSVCHNK